MKRLVILLSILTLFLQLSIAQKTVGLDNWFNHETVQKTGEIFHYTWNDKANSGFSQLGDLFRKHGAELRTITTSPNRKSMKDIDIYIIVDPDSTSENPSPNYINPDDVSFLEKWVKKGGVLLLMANDGPNCEFLHFNLLAEALGFHFQAITLNPVINRQWDMAAEINLPDHPLFSGVSKIYMKEVAPIILSKNAKPVLKDDNHVLIAETKYGKGYVLAVGDPWLYNEYIDHVMLPESFENLKAANNLVDLLLNK